MGDAGRGSPAGVLARPGRLCQYPRDFLPGDHQPRRLFLRPGQVPRKLLDPGAQPIRLGPGSLLPALEFLDQRAHARSPSPVHDGRRTSHRSTGDQAKPLVVAPFRRATPIREILDRGEHLPAVRLSADYIDLKETERAESLAIDTINAAPGSPNSTSAPAPQTATCSTWTQQYTALTRTGSTCENACQSALSASSPNFDRPRSSAPSTISDLVNVRGQRTSDPLRAPEAHAGNAQSHGMLDHSFQGHAVAWHDR